MLEERKLAMLETLKKIESQWEILNYTIYETHMGISIYGELKNKDTGFSISFRYSNHSTGIKRSIEEWYMCRIYTDETIEEINKKLLNHMQFMIEQVNNAKKEAEKRQTQEKYRENYINNRLQSLRIYSACKKITKKELQEKIRKLSFFAKCNYDKSILWKQFYRKT